MSAHSKLLASVCTAVCLILFSNAVFAAGTPANTAISNTATLAYAINGVTQTNITSPAASFVVDRKINLSVAEADGAPSIVGPGQAIAVTTFTVTNTGNDTQDFGLSTVNLPNGTIIFPPFSDSFDATGCAVFVESGANAGYLTAEDIATFIDELAPDLTKTVYVVCSIPPAQAINTVAAVSLTATTLIGGSAGTQGGALTNNVLTPNTAGVDTVFANPALAASPNGTIPAQAGADALATARDAYRVVSVATNVTKSATCSPAPADCSQAKTGTVITYQLLISVIGSGSADGLVITDPIPANLTYVTNSTTVGGSPRTDAIDADNTQFSANTVSVNFGNVVAPATLAIQFKATIN